VIAHPERHPHPNLSGRLARLASQGALVQVTSALLEDGNAAIFILELARRSVVHLLGSDAHSLRAGRPVRLSGGFAALHEGGQLGQRIEWMAREAPAAILAGEDVHVPFSPVSA
jgi:tyrosine-protein phosphatase YwqE